MGRLYERTRTLRVLRQAWARVKENGKNSDNEETRESVQQFEKNAETNLIRLQRGLRTKTFAFQPQTGITKKKSSGELRGIVMAPLENRIVERAILDVLQNDCAGVKAVQATETSVGGVPERSVPHGLSLIQQAFDDGFKYFIRSDIKGFFDNIPRQQVLEFLNK